MKNIVFAILLFMSFTVYSQTYHKLVNWEGYTTAEMNTLDVTDVTVNKEIWNTDTNTKWVYFAGQWNNMGSGGGGSSYTFSTGLTNISGTITVNNSELQPEWGNITSIPANLDTDSTDDVTLTGNQSVDGNKTFVGNIVLNNSLGVSDDNTYLSIKNLDGTGTQIGGSVGFSSIYFQEDGTLSISPSTASKGTDHIRLRWPDLTGVQTYDFPSIGGTVALTSDLTGNTDDQNLAEVLTEGNQANSEITEITYLRFSDEDSNSDHWYLDEELDGIYAGDYNFRHGPTSTVSARMYIPSDGVIDQPLHAATKAYVDANAGSGGISVSGTPTTGQLVRWTDASTLEAVTGMVYTDGNLLMAGAGLESSIGVQNVDDGAGHTGGLLEMVSSGWGEASIDFGGNPIWRATSGYSRFMNYNFGIQFMNSSNQPYLTLLNADNTATFLGDVTAPEFIGGGSGLTGVPTLANADQTITEDRNLQLSGTGTHLDIGGLFRAQEGATAADDLLYLGNLTQGLNFSVNNGWTFTSPFAFFQNSTPPTNVEARTYYDTDTNKPYFYNGIAWELFEGTHATAATMLLTGYSEGTDDTDVVETDNVRQAFAKLKNKIDGVSAGSFDNLTTFKDVTATTYTLLDSDASNNTKLRFNNASDITVSAPSSPSDGQVFRLAQYGAGKVQTNFTVNVTDAITMLPSTTAPGDNFILEYDAANSRWDITGKYEVAVDGTAPSVPTGLNSPSQTTTSVTLNWTASTDNTAVTGYEVSVDDGAPIDVGNVTTYEVTGLTTSTSYDFKVRAYDAIPNTSAYTSNITQSTSGGGAVFNGLNAADPVNEVNGIANTVPDANSTVTSTSNDPHTGSYELTITHNAAGSIDTEIILVGVTSGQNITTTFQGKQHTGLAWTTRLLSGDWTTTEQDNADDGVAGNWEPFTMTGTAAVDNPALVIRTTSGGASGDVFTVDNIVITVN